MNNDTLLMIKRKVQAEDDDVIIVLHIKQKDMARVTGALELAGITKQETQLVGGLK
jgi:uncharacterized protein YggE